MMGVYIGAACVGAGVAILQEYIEYRREKKLFDSLDDVCQRNKEAFSKLEQTFANMSPGEFRRIFGIVE